MAPKLINKSLTENSGNVFAKTKDVHKKIKEFTKQYDFIKFYSTLPRDDYLGLLKNCRVLVGNSSSGVIEASFFKSFSWPIVGGFILPKVK